MSNATPIEPTLDIPGKHFKLFVACNAKATPSFYDLKDKILKVFGHENDYDLQHIKKKCNACRGTGRYYRDRWCNRCVKGIYEAYDVVLKRYLLNGSAFHIPIGRIEGNKLKIWDGYYDNDEWGYPEQSKWRYEPFTGIIKGTINGLVKHKPVEGINTEYAYWYLLYHYDRSKFHEKTTSWLNCRWDAKEFQKRNYLWLTSDHGLTALAKYYNCEPF